LPSRWWCFLKNIVSLKLQRKIWIRSNYLPANSHAFWIPLRIEKAVHTHTAQFHIHYSQFQTTCPVTVKNWIQFPSKINSWMVQNVCLSPKKTSWKKMVPIFSASHITGLQIKVGHRILANQNLLMSDEIPTVVRNYVRKIFFMMIVNHFMVRMNKNLPWVNLTFLVMSDQDGVLAGHYVLSREKYYLQPWLPVTLSVLNIIIV